MWDMEIYLSKLVRNTWNKCGKDWYKVYTLTDTEIFEFLWAIVLLKRMKGVEEYTSIGKPQIRILVDMISNGKAPNNFPTYINAMAKKEYAKMLEEQKRIEYLDIIRSRK